MHMFQKSQLAKERLKASVSFQTCSTDLDGRRVQKLNYSLQILWFILWEIFLLIPNLQVVYLYRRLAK